MSAKTTNYGLKKPTTSEYFNVEDQNGNMDLIDTQLKTLDDNKESQLKNATAKASLADADTIPFTDSAASDSTKRIMFSNLKSALKTYFDTLYNKYAHPNYPARSAGLYKVTVDGTGHVSAAASITKSDITALGIPAQDTVTEVVDNLTSTDAGKALSAKQGSVLNNLVSTLSASIESFAPSIESLVPTGTILWYVKNQMPNGFLVCNGAEISRTTYSKLFQELVASAGFTAQAFTCTLASPSVFTMAAHGFNGGERIRLSTKGALPTGLDVYTDYYVEKITADTFYLSATPGGTRINATGSQSGTHSFLQSLYGLGNGSTTFNLPDLRGAFVRGIDDGKGIDTEATLGVTGAASKVGSSNSFATVTNSSQSIISIANLDTNQGFRPYYIALIPCIKY